MDKKIKLMNETINKHEEKYKNVIGIWKKYLNAKIERLHNDLDNFNNIFKDKNKLDSDLDIETIVLLYLLFNE